MTALAIWQSNFAYSPGDLVIPATPVGTGFYYECVTGGESGAAAPTMTFQQPRGGRESVQPDPIAGWPTAIGAEAQDGTVVWQCAGLVDDFFPPFIAAPQAPVLAWAPGLVVAVGQFVRPTSPSAFLANSYTLTFRCTSPGTTGTSEPKWPALGSGPANVNVGSPGGTIVTDGSVTWVAVDQTIIRPTGAGIPLPGGQTLFGPVPVGENT
jgi:hypothetical protein